MTGGMIFKVSVLAILRNKTRALLTCLGIIVGIAAVIAVLAIGRGASTMMLNEISSMGNNLIMIFPDRNRAGAVRSAQGSGQTLTADDAVALTRELPELVAATSPMINVSSQVIRGNRNCFTRINGVSESFPDIRNWNVRAGRFFSSREVDNLSRVCVIGETVRANLFEADEDPVGATVRVMGLPVAVVGVLEKKGANGWGQDQDDVIFVPYSTAGKVMSRSKFMNVNMINVSIRSMDDLAEAKRGIAALLRQRHKLPGYQDDDFELRDTREIMSTAGAVSTLMTTLLAAVAAISLFVGGIGIMNIMLVSVTERIREIGLRMAIGATPFMILSQFIVEAVLLSTAGGAIGVILGIFAANAIGEINHWPIVIETSSAAWSFLFSAFVGMFFGFYPAYRASRLNPIDCLRYE